MSYVITVTKRIDPKTVAPNEVHVSPTVKVFEQEFEELNLSKFARELNRPTRVRKAKTAKLPT